MTFSVIDKDTGREVSEKVISKIAKNGGLMEFDIDQFAVTEDGNIVLLDECGNFTYCVQDAFEIKIDEVEE